MYVLLNERQNLIECYKTLTVFFNKVKDQPFVIATTGDPITYEAVEEYLLDRGFCRLFHVKNNCFYFIEWRYLHE